MTLIRSIQLDGLLSFPPGMPEFKLGPINVLIGPNGSGKSNLLEAIELVKATPTDFASAIRLGGGAAEWIWKGSPSTKIARIEMKVGPYPETKRLLRYGIEFVSSMSRTELIDEYVEEAETLEGKEGPYFYYRFQKGHPVINARSEEEDAKQKRSLKREDLIPDQSVLAQRKDTDNYPELAWLGRKFSRIQLFREWSFGRLAELRKPQGADERDDYLLADSSNLAIMLNQILHTDPLKIDGLLNRFFPRFQRVTTKISGGTVQFFLHETEFDTPVPATRLSDGTLRFIAMLAVLLTPDPPPFLCIEEPELGLHPDAVALLAELIIDASERTQIIATTHSETFVSALTNQPDAVIACERHGAATELRRLNPELLSQWLDEYTLGDLWSMGHLGANP